MTINIDGKPYNEHEVILMEYRKNTHKDVKKFTNNIAAFILGAILVSILAVLMMVM